MTTLPNYPTTPETYAAHRIERARALAPGGTTYRDKPGHPTGPDATTAFHHRQHEFAECPVCGALEWMSAYTADGRHDAPGVEVVYEFRERAYPDPPCPVCTKAMERAPEVLAWVQMFVARRLSEVRCDSLHVTVGGPIAPESDTVRAKEAAE